MSSFQWNLKCMTMRLSSTVVDCKLSLYSFLIRKAFYLWQWQRWKLQNKVNLPSFVSHRQNCELNYSNCKIWGLGPKEHRLSLKKKPWENQFNLQAEIICTECNWERINMELHDVLHLWYLLKLFPRRPPPLNSLEKRRLSWNTSRNSRNNRKW